MKSSKEHKRKSQYSAQSVYHLLVPWITNYSHTNDRSKGKYDLTDEYNETEKKKLYEDGINRIDLLSYW